MKRQALKWLFLLGMILFVPSLRGQSSKTVWDTVEEYKRQDRPRKAIQLLDRLCRRAEEKKLFPLKVKAMMTRLECSAMISRDSMYKNVSNFQKWVTEEPDAARQKVLLMMLGNMYDFVEQLTPYDSYHTEGRIPTDMSEWSREVFAQKKHEAYCQALSDFPLLAKASIFTYKILIETGAESDLYRNDLLSAMVQEIVQRYTKESDKAFVTDIYNRMIACYQSLGRKNAMWMARLAKFDYEYQSSYEKRAMLADTLQSWIAQNKGKMIAPYIYQKAIEKADSDSLQYVLSTEALSLYPDYKFVDFFKERIHQTTFSFCRAQLAETPMKGHPLRLNVNYRSLDKLTMNVFRKADRKQIEHTVFQLPVKAPYRETDTILCLKPLPEVGEYVIELQAGKKKETLDVNYTMLFMPILSSFSDKQANILVVDNVTGFPVENATVELMKVNRSRRKEVYTSIQKLQTGADGHALFKRQNNSLLAAFVQKEGYGRTDTVKFYMSSVNEQDVSKTTNIRLYTDRAVYRPGICSEQTFAPSMGLED